MNFKDFSVFFFVVEIYLMFASHTKYSLPEIHTDFGKPKLSCYLVTCGHQEIWEI